MQHSPTEPQRKMHPGISQESIDTQLGLIRRGLSFASLERPCVIGDGIRKLEDPSQWAEAFMRALETTTLLKFVPASGAASRMFKHAYSGVSGVDKLREELQRNFRSLPFFSALKSRFPEVELWINSGQWDKVFDLVMDGEGMGYHLLPKGLVPFHAYGQNCRTAFEEHLHESVRYSKGTDDTCHIHFTVSDQWRDRIERHLDAASDALTATVFDVSTSVQHPETDTICVTPAGQPLKIDGKLYFRPGGHGALLANLNELSADVIFIKNIDNVQPDRTKQEVALWKKALGGLLLESKKKMDAALAALEDSGSLPSEEVASLLQEMGHPTDGFESNDQWRLALDRPMRICGMVRNAGEPGGGPFWVRQLDGSISPQIVEKPQIDLSDPGQKDILRRSTHFNPVDLVCAKRRYDGSEYELFRFSDPNTSFITEKSVGGVRVKALEHPGLWNGAMAFWNTLFVEVPLATFSPVKTVNDLLRPAHQT